MAVQEVEVNVINTDEVGLGLELTGGLIKAKIDPKDGNALTVTEAGLAVDLPVAQEPVVALADADYVEDGHKLVFTKTDGSTAKEVVLPATPVDIHVNGLNFAEDGTLTVELEGAEPKTTNITGEIIGKLLINAPVQVKSDLADALAPLVLAKLKGNKLKRVNGETMGYLLPESVA